MENRRQSPPQDLDIRQDTLIFNVLDVIVYYRIKVYATSSPHLGQARDARQNLQAFVVPGLVFLDFPRHVGPWAYQAHLPSEHVDESGAIHPGWSCARCVPPG